MTTREWIKQVIDAGLLCGEYTGKVSDALSKTSIMDIVLDSNGISYIPEMRAKGFQLPYEAICNEYGSFINGRYVRDKDGYTSCLYCLYNTAVELKTTLTCFLGCKCDVVCPENYFCEIHVDQDSKLDLVVPESSRVRVFCYGEAECRVFGNGFVELNRK